MLNENSNRPKGHKKLIEMRKMADNVYEKFNEKRKHIERVQADADDMAELKQLEEKIVKK